MAFRRVVGMPLSEPMGTQFMLGYMRPHAAELIVDDNMSALQTRQQAAVNNLTTSDVASYNHYLIVWQLH